MASTDRIEKKVVLKTSKARLWRALSNPAEFGTWFGARLDGPFVPGQSILGQLTIKNYDHLTIELRVERMEPEHLFSYRWHPYALDESIDYSTEPMTLVEFRLAEVEGGTELTIVESGFDKIPEHRRAEAFRMNDGGWTGQVKNIAKHVEG